MAIGQKIKNAVLTGALALGSFFSTNAQDVKSPSMPQDSVQSKNKPHALMIRSKMSLTSDLYERDGRQNSFNTVASYYNQHFNIHMAGNGFDIIFPFDDDAIDGGLDSMAHNPYYFVYTNTHGLVNNFCHVMSLGYDIKPKQAGVHAPYLPTVHFFKNKIVKHASDHNRKPIHYLTDTCAGEKFITDLDDVDLPPGSQVEVFSRQDDVTFDPAISLAVTGNRMPSHVDPGDLRNVHINSNNYTFDDSQEAETQKHKKSPAGSTLMVVKDNGEKVVFCPRKSAWDRIGKGLTDKDRETIIDNYKKFYDNNGYAYQYKKATILKDLGEFDQNLKDATTFENMPRVNQHRALKWGVLLQEETSMRDFKAFIDAESAGVYKPPQPKR